MRTCLALALAAVLGSGTATGPAAAQAPPPGADRVVLVTLDGVRTQELFGGLDTLIVRGAPSTVVYDSAVTLARYWRATPEARRRALMPFFWDSLVPRGVLYGNAARGSRARVRNGLGFSYPGYTEIVTGRPQPSITSNDPVPSPVPTVLEFIRRRLRLPRTDVAVIGSWGTLRQIAQQNDGTLMVKAGPEPMPREFATPVTAALDSLQPFLLPLWEGSELDPLTVRYAIEYLRTAAPRVLWLGLGESDEWAHLGRYDRLLDCLHALDAQLQRLWSTLQSLRAYRGRTTLVVTTDHGRGQGAAGWSEHGEGDDGSNDIWIAVAGPHTPARGEMGPLPTVYQSQVAATLLAALGLDARDYAAEADAPLPGAIDRH